MIKTINMTTQITTQQNNQIEHWQSNLGLNLRAVEKSLNQTDAEIVRACSGSTMIMNLPDETFHDNLRKMLAKIGLTCGIKNPPTEIESTILINFLRKHYRTTTVAEIELAFELNMTNQLQKRHEHFHNLNIDFVTSVLNDFKYSRKLEAFKSFRIAETNNKKIEHNMTDEEAFNALIELSDEMNEPPKFFAFSKAYRHYVKIGLETRTIDERRAFKESVRKSLNREKQTFMNNATTTTQRRRVEDDFNEDRLISECHKQTLIQYIEQRLKQKTAGTLFDK